MRLLKALLAAVLLCLGAAPVYGQDVDLAAEKTASPDPVAPGALVTYVITVTNVGPDNATTPSLADPLPAGTTFESLSAPGGWSCTSPAVGAPGTVSCSAASLASGASALFSLQVRVDPAAAPGTTIVNAATVTSSAPDPNPENDSGVAGTTVLGPAIADLGVTKTASPDPVAPGQVVSFDITVTNAGPAAATTPSLADPLPAGTTFNSLTTGSAPGWSCTSPAVGAPGTVSCSAASLAGGASALFTLHVRVDAAATDGTTIVNAATVASATTDPSSENDSAVAGATVMTRTIIRALVFGAGEGGLPHVRVFDRDTLDEVWDFLAYDAAFSGGARVALGDLNGDGQADVVTGAGAGGGPHVRVLDIATQTEIRSLLAYAPAFAGGVFVAAGDVNGDGLADIITGAGPGGGPHVRVLHGVTGAELMSFLAYDPGFAGGVSVAAGDVNGDGLADILTGAGPGGGPHVRVFDGATGAELHSFYAYPCDDHVLGPCFRGGVFVAAGDVNGDGRADVITGAGPGGGPHVRVFDGVTGAELAGFFAYAASFTGGVRVAAGDVNGDGTPDILTGAGPGGGPHFRAFHGATLQDIGGFFAFAPAFTGGIFLGGP